MLVSSLIRLSLASVYPFLNFFTLPSRFLYIFYYPPLFMNKITSSLSVILGSLLANSALLVAQEEAASNANLREAYVLRPNDVVELSVYEEPDLAKIATILKTGEASFPLIGAVNLKGLSLGKTSEKIRALYAADYIRYPRVNLSVSEYAVDYVNVIGMVITPGKIPIPQFSDLDLRAAVANAGGLTALADRDKIVYNPINGEAREFSYDFIRQKGDTVILKSGDQIVVRESPFAG